MLRKQHKVDDSHYDMPFVYYIEGHALHFGRHEFCLMTGLRFGSVSFGLYTSGSLNFRNRVFLDKQGYILTNLDVIGVIEDEERFGQISDEDDVRLCLLLALEVIFMGRLLTCEVDDTLMRLVDNLDDWNAFPWGEHIWTHLYDQLHNVFDKHVDDHLLRLKKDPKHCPTYTLSGFVFGFQVWILESFEKSHAWWIKHPNVIPRALAWSRKSIFNRTDRSNLFSNDSTTITDLRPTIHEFQCAWWIDSQDFFNDYVPRPPVRTQHNLVDTYFLRLEKSRQRAKTGLKVNSKQCKSGSSSRTKSLKDHVISSLNRQVFKLECIIQVLAHDRTGGLRDKLDFESHFPNTRTAFSDSLNSIYLKLIDLPESDVDVAQEYLLLEELRFALAEEERLQLEEDKMNAEANILRLEEANRLRLEEADMLKLEEEKKKKRRAFMNSSHFQKALSRLPPDKRILMELVSPQKNQEVKRRKIKKHGPNMNDPTIAEELNRVKPWVEDLSRWFHSVETLFLSDEIEEFLCDPDRHRCKFPWSDDYTVDCNFWLRLVCLDPGRKGWLTEEHIDLWVDYMWYVRPENANWAMVSSYFVQILLQNGMPVFYADGTRYPMPWNDVEQVFIPLNETVKHWCLAQFNIPTGVVTFYDSGDTRDYESRVWYVRVRECLQVKLPVVLEQANIFDKTGIHPNHYKISFRLAENVPKQGGIFGDCGVWVCIFLYRLAHGLSLHVDDPADVALAYREKMIQFFYKHRFYRLY